MKTITTNQIQQRLSQIFPNAKITKVEKPDTKSGEYIPGMCGVFMDGVTYTTFLLNNLKYLLLSTGQTFNF